MSERIERWKDRATRLVAWVKDRREVRALQWYGARRGNLLAGGIAYTALFAIGAGLTIGFSVFSATLGSRPDLMAAVTDQIELWLPGLIGDGPEQVQPEDLVVDDIWNLTTFVATVVLLWTAVSFMGALRHSIRSMFDAPVVGENPVLAKVWQLAGFVVLGAMIVVTAAASILASTVENQLENWFGDSRPLAVLLAVGGLAVAVVLDAVVVYLMVRVVGRVRPRRQRDLVLGCLVAGVVSGALRYAGTSLVTSSVSSNVVLGSFVTIGTILLLANFLSRMLLILCAWMHDPPRMDEVVRAEDEVAEMRRQEEIDRIASQGAGHGKPYSPVVRGVRRGRLAD